MNFKNYIKYIKTAGSKHGPAVLIVVGTVGLITAIPMAVKATPKALKLIEEEKTSQNVEDLSPIDTVKVAWKCYIPTAILTASSIGCIVGGNKMWYKREAAIATAYIMSKEAFKEYKEKAIEVLGEKKEQTIVDKIAKDKVDKNPVSKNEVMYEGMNEHLCYDSVLGRYFRTSIAKIQNGQTTINSRLLDEHFISINEMCSEIGEPLVDPSVGDVLGWNLDDRPIEIRTSYQKAENGEPVLVISYNVSPRYDYRTWG